ncbi:MAG: hypothetical protein ACTSVL_10115, partial [Promethearchaeota archaeon]
MSHHYPLKSLFVVLVLFGTILNISTNLQSSPESLKSQESSSMISSGNEISPKHSAIENSSSFNSQLVEDSEFSEPFLTSPWNYTKDGDLSDTDGLLENSQANSIIVGDQGTFSDFESTFSSPEWKFNHNPEYPTYPDTFLMNDSGFAVSHDWAEDANQSTAVQLERNFSTSVNMSDYVITSASVSAVFNASVHGNNGAEGGIDVSGDDTSGWAYQFGTYDYARFYILISDLNHQNQNEVAYNQTVDLGKDSSGVLDIINDTLFSSESEESLILYLTSALATNGINFTASLGIRIWSEDNYGSDDDIWDSLIIKNFNLSFTYEKKIDQGTFISLNQIGNKIDSSLYSGNNLHIQIDNATLNFGTKINGIWPSSSPNSEIRIIINGYQHTETIKLENLNSSWQFVKAGNGFDVSSFIHPDENISLQIQIYVADTFQLLSNLTISLDNVTLDVGFTVITDFEPFDTSLMPVESISPEIQWNESFSIQFNYTNTNTSSGIENSDFNVVWLGESIAYNEISNGIYQINATTDPNKTVANRIYPLEITANPIGQYLEKSLTYEIKVIGRSTKLDIFLNEENMTESPIIEIPYQSSLNISALYYDTNSLQHLQNASGGLSGGSINSSAWNVTYKGDFYEFSLNTTELGLGTHLITLNLNLDNYIVGSKLIRVEVISRFTDLFVKFNGVNATNNPEFKIPINEIVNLSVLYQDHENSQNLANASITLEGINSTSYNSSTNGTIHQFSINTSLLEIKTYYVWVKAELENYEQISYLIEIEIVPRITSFLIQLNGTNMMNLDISNEISIPITTILNFTALYSDFDLNYSVPNGLVSISNFTNNGLTKIQNGDKFEFIINSSAVGLGSYFITLAGTGNEFYQQQSQILQ